MGKKVVIILLVCFSLQKAFGFNIRKYDTLDGLSENSVMCAIQDPYDYMWFGTKDGLNRFNGIKFEQFKQMDISGVKKSREIFFINTLLNNSNHKDLWIGSTEGLFYFKRSEYKIYPVYLNKEKQIPFPDLYGLLYDSDNNLWIATHHGLYVMKPDGTIKTYLKEGTAHNLPSNAFESLFIDSKNRLWIGSNKGLCLYVKETDSFRSFYKDYLHCSFTDNNYITCFQQDTEGKLWFGTFEGGLYRVDQENMQIQSHFTGNDIFKIKRLRTIFNYTSNSFLIGSGDGLFLYNYEENVCKKYLDPLKNESVRSICKDREGGIWIGTFFNGVSYISPIDNNFQHIGGTGKISLTSGICFGEMCEDNHGGIWITSENKGLFYYDPKHESLLTFREKFVHPAGSISYNNLHALLIDGNKLWVACYTKGVDLVDLRTGSVKNYMKNESLWCLPHNNVNAIYKTSSGRIFLGSEDGLCYYDPAKDGFIPVHNFDKISVYCLQEDFQGHLWIGTESNGLFRYNLCDIGKSAEILHYYNDGSVNTFMTSNNIRWFYMDKQKKQIWMGGTGSGITCYAISDKKFIHYGDGQGLECYNTYGLLKDDFGKLWISSNQGLYCYSPNNYTIKRYTHEDGLQSNQFNPKSFYRANDGRFYFGGVNGFNTFIPNEIMVNNCKPITDISYIECWKSRTAPPDIIGIPDDRTIRLSYKNKSFRIIFNSLSFVRPEKNIFEYKLEPIQNEWITTGDRYVSLLNLPAGDYKFIVRGSNNDGYFSNNENSVRINIEPVPWKSKLALITYAIIVLLLVVYIIRFINKRRREKELIRMQEFEQKKEIESFQSKIQFFTQIIHEIKTPLSLIISPLDEIIESKGWNKQTPEYLNIIKKNTNRLMALVRQLLDFRKIEQGTYKLDLIEVNVNQHINDMLETFNTKGKTDINIVSQYSSDNIIFPLDKEAFTKIISNLLINALKYARHIVVIKAEELFEDGTRKLSVSVRDDGIGIDSAKKNLIFEPFYQIPSSEKLSSGIGLGLSLVNSLVKKHDGVVFVNEQYTAGLEIILKIPEHRIINKDKLKDTEDNKIKIQADLTDIQNSKKSMEEVPAYSFETGIVKSGSAEKNRQAVSSVEDVAAKPVILLVDDEPELLRFLKDKFSVYFDVFTAENGVEAIDLLKLYEIDLILSDLMMPQMDGFELLKKIKNDPQNAHIPFVLLTAQNSDSQKLETLHGGAEAYIEKPFNVNYLISLVVSIINNRKRQNDYSIESSKEYHQGKILRKADKEWLDNINAIILKNLTNEGFDIDSLCSEIFISRSNLQRKFKSITKQTVGQYIRSVRMDMAYKLLNETELSITQVSETVGLGNITYFSNTFTNYFGFSPKDLRKQSK
jgi:ligand-binding sensor domain-containing protein/signal transduction histidine kinase/AraC-like DNA-binding protein